MGNGNVKVAGGLSADRNLFGFLAAETTIVTNRENSGFFLSLIFFL